MASVAFTDGTGAVTLSNGRTGPAGRFADWRPLWAFEGSRRQGPGMTAPAAFILREDYGASFALVSVPAASLDQVIRLKRHLELGGLCTVTTDDAASRVYTSCALYPGQAVDWSLEDPDTQEVRVTLAVARRDGVAAAMLCVY